MRQRNGVAAGLSRNLWAYFPWFIVAAMSTVVAVNCFMAYSALHTFPGEAGNDGFDLSNHYDTILERVRQEAGLGWAVQANVDQVGHPVVTVIDRSASPLARAEVKAIVQRPLGDRHMHQVQFMEVSPGQYRGDVALDKKGQWQLEIWVTADGQEFRTTRRIVAR